MKRSPVRVAVAGAHGKMGRVTVAAMAAADDIDYVGGLVRAGAQQGEFADPATMFAHAKPDVLVDFTRFPQSLAIALAAIAAGVRPVVGTSGYGPEHLAQLRAACEKARVGCAVVPNFAVGAVLMMKFAEEAGRYYQAVEIIELHGAGKKDAPSGTAMATARRLADAASFERARTEHFKAEGARGAEHRGVGIHSLRLPGVVAHQEVIFGGDGETLRIVHDSTSRESFMPGVLLAVRAAATLDRFVEGLEQFL